MTPKEKAKELFHDCLNRGRGFISDYLAGEFAMLMVQELIAQDKGDYFIKVKKELKILLNYK